MKGTLNKIALDGTATVYLNGQKIEPDEYDSQFNTLRIVGSGNRADYQLGVSGAIDEARSDLNPQDSIASDGKSASGFVFHGSDTYVFTDDLSELSLSSDATVYLNGQEIDPADYGTTNADRSAVSGRTLVATS